MKISRNFDHRAQFLSDYAESKNTFCFHENGPCPKRSEQKFGRRGGTVIQIHRSIIEKVN